MDELLKNPQVLSFLLSLLGRLLHPEPKVVNPPAVVITKPVPNPVQVDNIPDDIIPVPKSTRKVVRVKYNFTKAQYSKSRFPKMYTEENPFGLYSQEDLREIENGNKNFNYESKVWATVSGYDAEGHEFLYHDNLSLGLAYKTEIHFGDAFIKGHGPDPILPNRPAAGYETNDTDAVGQGFTAWGGNVEQGIESTSLGFLQQFKVFAAADGKKFDCYGSIDGVESNHFIVGVS